MKVVCIVQARLNSTRLPRKVLLDLCGKPLLWHLLERVQRAKSVHQILVTCPINDVLLISKAVPTGILIDPYMGDENELVDRHLQSATWAEADLIVRIPGDNPCVDHVYIDEAVEAYMGYPFIYYSNTTAGVGDILVDGIGAEVCSMSRLRWLDQRTHGQEEWREHPHRYFEDQGLVGFAPADLRLDVNTQDDYDFIKDIYDHFQRNDFTSAQVVAYLDSKKVAV